MYSMWKATYPRIFGRHKLVLMSSKKKVHKVGYVVEIQGVWENEYDQNIAYKILKELIIFKSLENKNES